LEFRIISGSKEQSMRIYQESYDRKVDEEVILFGRGRQRKTTPNGFQAKRTRQRRPEVSLQGF
jgi:hypothetical protein